MSITFLFNHILLIVCLSVRSSARSSARTSGWTSFRSSGLVSRMLTHSPSDGFRVDVLQARYRSFCCSFGTGNLGTVEIAGSSALNLEWLLKY